MAKGLDKNQVSDLVRVDAWRTPHRESSAQALVTGSHDGPEVFHAACSHTGYGTLNLGWSHARGLLVIGIDPDLPNWCTNDDSLLYGLGEHKS